MLKGIPLYVNWCLYKVNKSIDIAYVGTITYTTTVHVPAVQCVHNWPGGHAMT